MFDIKEYLNNNDLSKLSEINLHISVNKVKSNTVRRLRFYRLTKSQGNFRMASVINKSKAHGLKIQSLSWAMLGHKFGEARMRRGSSSALPIF